MTKVNCLKGIIAKLSGKSISAIKGDTVCDCLHQLVDCVEPKFVINITEEDDPEQEGQKIYSSDKTLDEIIAAHEAGKVIECHYSVFALHPLMISDSVCSFSCDVTSSSTTSQRTTINITTEAVGISVLNYTLTPVA